VCVWDMYRQRGQKFPHSLGVSASLSFIKYANEHQNEFRVRFWLQALVELYSSHTFTDDESAFALCETQS